MKEQANQVLEYFTHHKDLLQDVSIAHAILTPESHVFHSYTTRSLITESDQSNLQVRPDLIKLVFDLPCPSLLRTVLWTYLIDFDQISTRTSSANYHH